MTDSKIEKCGKKKKEPEYLILESKDVCEKWWDVLEEQEVSLKELSLG